MSQKNHRDTASVFRLADQNLTGQLYGVDRNAERARVQRHQPKRFCREESVRNPCPKFPVLQTQLAEGFEPPTL